MATFLVLSCSGQQSTAYIYDGANRLSQINYGGCVIKKYFYDNNGNRTGERKITVKTRDSVWNETCPRSNDGRIKLLPENASSNYTYTWSTGFVGNYIANLSPGTYAVDVKDINANVTCTRTYTILAQFVDSFTVDIQNNTCIGYTQGKVRVRVVTPDPRIISPLKYTYQWNGIGAFTTTDSLINLKAGNYFVTIRNEYTGCNKIVNFTLTDPPKFYSITQANNFCYGANQATASISLLGGPTNYSIAWFNSTNQIIATGVTQINNLFSGNYFINIKQNLSPGCLVRDSFLIHDPLPIINNVKTTKTTCKNTNDGVAEIISNGLVSQYVIEWKNLQTGQILAQTSSILKGLSVGKYSVKLTERGGNLCSMTDTFDITEPALIAGAGLVYPNPTTGEVKLEICGLNSTSVRVQIINTLEQILDQKTISTITGTNIVSLDLKKYSSGTYFITVIFDNNSKQTFKVVKNK